MANEIPLDEAVLQTANWRTLANQKLSPDDIIQAFTVPLENFEQIKASGAVKIRAYIGNTETNEKTLLLVGVDAQGNDMIDYNNGKFVYDHTTPCPPSCSSGSPLT